MKAIYLVNAPRKEYLDILIACNKNCGPKEFHTTTTKVEKILSIFGKLIAYYTK